MSGSSDDTRAGTPGQTIGPFFGYALPYAGGESLVPLGHPGAIRLTGRVLDGAGEPVPDALVELWQADADGVIPHRGGSLHRDGYTFTGWGRSATDALGRYSFTTVLPAPTPAGRPSRVAVALFARGILDRLTTRIYLDDGNQAEALAADPLLSSLPAPERAALIATRSGSEYRFDFRLQGPQATPFLQYGGSGSRAGSAP